MFLSTEQFSVFRVDHGGRLCFLGSGHFAFCIPHCPLAVARSFWLTRSMSYFGDLVYLSNSKEALHGWSVCYSRAPRRFLDYG